MKKLIFTLLLVISVINLMAEEHLSFKGIPIKGSVTEFCQKLNTIGFKTIGQKNNIRLFLGDFTGQNAIIAVEATVDKKNVYGVSVLFDPSGEWNKLVDNYDYYKKLYSKKYGEPTNSKEKNPALSDSNTALMREVHQGTVEWISVWEVTGGIIMLSIDKTTGIYEGVVVIRYLDSQNVETKIQKDLGDI